MSGAKRLLTDDRGEYGQTFIDERHLTGDYVVHTHQDCEPILKAAGILREIPPSSEFRHVGFVPDVFLDDILRKARERAGNDGAALKHEISAGLKAFLNDSSMSAFRTWPGKV